MSYKVVLVAPYAVSHRTAEETIALGYLASVLRKSGYVVVIIDGWLRGVGPQEIVSLISESCYPSVICFSCYRSNLEQARLTAMHIKEMFGKLPIVCGGYGPTFYDEDFLEAGFDVAVRGEAEHIISPLIERLTTNRSLGDVHGITFKQDGRIVRTNRLRPIEDLDEIPVPARDELRFSMMRRNPVHICTSRGCNGNCSFCSVFSFSLEASGMSRWRQRSIGSIVDEMKCLYEEFGATHFKIIDDSFIEPPRDERWSYELAEAIRRRNLRIRFRTQVRADRLTRPIVENLKNCGWFATSIGIENFSESALVRMHKKASRQDNLYALELLREYEIFAQIGLIMFDHATTIDELEENCRMLSRHNWIVTKGIFTEMFAAEGTPFTNKLMSEGLLKTIPGNQNYHYDTQDPLAQRVHAMLKKWHKSHAELYDWVIDSISAPKVMTEGGYISVHRICTQLLSMDIDFLNNVLEHVRKNSAEEDMDLTNLEISSKKQFYENIERRIGEIYTREGLAYDGVINPFLS